MLGLAGAETGAGWEPSSTECEPVVRYVEDGQADGGEHEDDRRPGGEPGEHIGRGAGTEGGLRTLAAEGACQVGRAALLQEDDADEKEAHNDVQDDDEVEKNLHFPAAFQRLPAVAGQKNLWCGGGDLNPYALWASAPQAGVSANFTTSAQG